MAWRGLIVTALWLWTLAAAANPVRTEHVTAHLLARHTHAVAGETAQLLLVLEIRPHWHTYWRNPGDSGEAPRIDWSLPRGVRAGPLGFTLPELIRVGPLANYGYSGRALHPVTLDIPADWPAGRPLEIVADAHWLVCEEHCIPESARLGLRLAVETAAPAPVEAVAAWFEDAYAALPAGEIPGAELAAADGVVRLSVPWRDAGDPPRGQPSGVWFFAGNWGLIEHAAEQAWSLLDDGSGARLVLDLAAGDASGSAATDGLLVVTDAAGAARGYRLTPERVGVEEASPPAPPDSAAVRSEVGLGLALGLAFLGGLILNLMPCVFPVLAIKALSLAGQGGASARERGLQGLAYTAGVLLFFLLLGVLLLGLRAGGASVGWGFQLQYPPFVAVMAYVFLVLGLGLSGAVNLGGGLMNLAGGAGQRAEGPWGSFLTGALAALVAAPCTAPFMGTALGYAVTLPWVSALAVMVALGLGLATPFLLLTLWPGLARRLPRPGPWMETLKELLAFPMFAAAAWLLWVLAVQTGPGGLALALAGMLLLTFGLWLRERTRQGSQPWERAGVAGAVAALAGALWLGYLSGDSQAPRHDAGTGLVSVEGGERVIGGSPEVFSPDRLAALRAEGRPVFVNMTAAWCITCLVNERVALEQASVIDAFAAVDLVYLKGDWTQRDADITEYLAGFGRNGVPIYVLYPPGAAPVVLPQILTPAIVTRALAEAGLTAPDRLTSTHPSSIYPSSIQPGDPR